jgi:hypothetical protein
MSTYRVFRVVDFERRGQPIDIEVDSDSEAIRKAEQHLDGMDLLLWEGTRFVITLRSKKQ